MGSGFLGIFAWVPLIGAAVRRFVSLRALIRVSFAGFSDERTVELTSRVGAGLTGRTVADLVSFYGKSALCFNTSAAE